MFNMKENQNVPQPLNDEALEETTGGTFFGMQPKALTMENIIVMRDQQEETICTVCGKIKLVPVGTKRCACGGKLEKHITSSASFCVEL